MSKRLGRGLADLIQTQPLQPQAPSAASTATTEGTHEAAQARASLTLNQGAPSAYVRIPLGQIRAGRYQPRTSINEQDLSELRDSIKRQGVIEPVLVRPLGSGSYELIAGERRWRASQALGLRDIPAIIKPLSDKEALEYSLVENIQREDLNPIEEAHGYQRLMDEFGYTQEEVSQAVSRPRTTIANMLRLLKLPEMIQAALRSGALSFGHAKALLSVETQTRQLELFARATKEGWSVRELEARAMSWAQAPARKTTAAAIDAETKSLQERLCQQLGTKVRVQPRKKGGRLVIEYFSNEDLTRLIDLFKVDPHG